MLDVWVKEEGRMAELPVHGIGDCAVPFGYDWVLMDLYSVDGPPMDDLPEEAGAADWVFDTMEEAEWAASVLEKVCPVFDLYESELSELREDEFWGIYQHAVGSESFDAFDELRVKAYGQLCVHLSSEASARIAERVAAAVDLVRDTVDEYPPDAFGDVACEGVSLRQAALSVVNASDNLGLAASAVGDGIWDSASSYDSWARIADTRCLYDVIRIAEESDGIVGEGAVRFAEAYLAAWGKVLDASFHVEGEVERCTKRLEEVREALGL